MSVEFELPARREPDTPASASTVRRWWRSPRLLLCLILLVSGGAIVLAMRRTSTTFDEIVLHPEYPKLAREIRGLLNAQENAHD